jgi:hypothetical protein
MKYNHRIQANSLTIKDKGWEKAIKIAYGKDINIICVKETTYKYKNHSN